MRSVTMFRYQVPVDVPGDSVDLVRSQNGIFVTMHRPGFFSGRPAILPVTLLFLPATEKTLQLDLGE